MKKLSEFLLSLKSEIEFGSISTKDTYNITPAAKDILKDNQPVFKDLLKKTTKLPITVDSPASNVIEKAKRKELSKKLIYVVDVLFSCPMLTF
jgi:lipid A disaccharide synthetase